MISIWFTRRNDKRAQRLELATYPRIGVTAVDPLQNAKRIVSIQKNPFHDHFIIKDVPESDGGEEVGALIEIANYGEHPLPNLAAKVTILFDSAELGWSDRNVDREENARLPLRGLMKGERCLVRLRNDTKAKLTLIGDSSAFYDELNVHFRIDSVAETWTVELKPRKA
jgi:hypothetical protein